MIAGVFDLIIQKGETFSRDINPLVTKTSVRAYVSTAVLKAETEITISSGGIGEIEAGDFIVIANRSYEVDTGIADVSLGGTLEITTPLIEGISAGTEVLVYSQFDLTGYSARAQLRPSADSGTKTADFDCAINGNIITVSLTDSQTASIYSNAKKRYDTPQIYSWDLEIVSGTGIVTRLLNGAVEVSPEVTR